MYVLSDSVERSVYVRTFGSRGESRRIEAESNRSELEGDGEKIGVERRPDEGRQRDWVEEGRAVCSGGRPGLIRKVDIVGRERGPRLPRCSLNYNIPFQHDWVGWERQPSPASELASLSRPMGEAASSLLFTINAISFECLGPIFETGRDEDSGRRRFAADSKIISLYYIKESKRVVRVYRRGSFERREI